MESKRPPWSSIGAVVILTAGAIAWFVWAQLGTLGSEEALLQSGLPSGLSSDVRRSERRSQYERRRPKREVVANLAPSRARYAEHLPPPGRTRNAVLLDELLRRGFAADPADADEVRAYRETILHGPTAEEREDAILMLSGNEHPKAVRTFIQATNDSSPSVRLAALDALGDYAEYLRPTVFAGLLSDRDPEVRFETVGIIGDMQGPEATRLVRAALHDSDPYVRRLAGSTLAFRIERNRR